MLPGAVFSTAVLLVCAAIAIVRPGHAQSPTEPFTAAVRDLRRAITPQRDGSHLARLFALRQLRDPSLAPLLRRLARDGSWQVQVHATLGLAEIRDPQRIDPALVKQLDAGASEALIANALDMDLIAGEQIRELLQWPDLPPMSRLLLVGELILDDATVEPADVGQLASSEDLRVAGLASLLLARLGDPAAFSTFTDRLATVPRRERDHHVLFVLEAIRQYEVVTAVPWVRRLLEESALTDDARYWAIHTVVDLDVVTGLSYWSAALGDQPAYRDRLRYGMMLLAAGPDVPFDTFDRLGDGDDLILAIADAGRVMHTGADPSAALITLIEMGHFQSTRWAMDALTELPPAEAERVYLHILETVERDEPGRAERVARAVESAARLFEIDPALVRQLLEHADDDGLMQEAILLGLFESRSAAAGDAARTVRRIGAGRADSLALLLIARHADTLEPGDLEMLGRIAAGGGRVSQGLQVQAAWLYLKHSNALDQALTLVIDPETP